MGEETSSRAEIKTVHLKEFMTATTAESWYLLALLVFLVQGFLDTTMFPYVMPETVIPVLKGIAFGMMALKMVLFDFKSSVIQLAMALSILFLSAVSMFVDGYAAPMQFFIVVIGAYRVNFDKIVKLYFWASVTLTIVTITCALIGVIENVAIPRGTSTAYAFGFYYISEFSAHVLSITLSWLYLNRHNLSIRIYLPAIIWSVVVYKLADGKMAFLLSLLIIVGVAISEAHRKIRSRAYQFPRIFIASFFAMAALSAWLMIFFNDSGVMSWLNNILTNRLYYAHKGFLQYGVTAFGQQIDMLGWGGGKVINYEDYFYIDCSYVNILLRYGIVILLLVLTLCTVPLIRAKRNAGIIAWLLFGIALASFINEHLMGIPYNIFALMTFASCSDYAPTNILKKIVNAREGRAA